MKQGHDQLLGFDCLDVEFSSCLSKGEGIARK